MMIDIITDIFHILDIILIWLLTLLLRFWTFLTLYLYNYWHYCWDFSHFWHYWYNYWHYWWYFSHFWHYIEIIIDIIIYVFDMFHIDIIIDIIVEIFHILDIIDIIIDIIIDVFDIFGIIFIKLFTLLLRFFTFWTLLI